MLLNKTKIIAGQFRGRSISFPSDIEGLRPTTNRTRETVFNWLQPYIQDSLCLDTFAGSGAMGIEALSRGAKFVLFLDQSKKIIQSISQNLETLKLSAEQAKIYYATLPKQLEKILLNLDLKFNIIFLDPPFNKNLLEPCLKILSQSEQINQNALFYVETELNLENLTLILPKSFNILKHKRAGAVNYFLIT